MVSQLPVRINFSLPDGWQAAPPDDVGAPGVAFAALHPDSADNFTANITIAGRLREPSVPMADIADESVRRMQDSTGTVHVRQRNEVGTDESPGITQLLDIMALVENRPLPLVQSQVYLSIPVNTPPHRAVVELILTCKPTQLETVFDDFQEFVNTVKPVSEEADAASDGQ